MRTTGAGEGVVKCLVVNLMMRAGEGFSDFMRNVRIVKEETIEAYIDYIEKVAAKLGKRCVDLACSSSQLNKTFTSIDDVKDWARKTKDN